jgi:hypothetical protein
MLIIYLACLIIAIIVMIVYMNNRLQITIHNSKYEMCKDILEYQQSHPNYEFKEIMEFVRSEGLKNYNKTTELLIKKG